MSLFCFKDLLIYSFLEAGGETGRETLIGCLLVHALTRTQPTTQAPALTANWTDDCLLCRTAPNLLSHTIRARLVFVSLKMYLFCLNFWRMFLLGIESFSFSIFNDVIFHCLLVPIVFMEKSVLILFFQRLLLRFFFKTCLWFF